MFRLHPHPRCLKVIDLADLQMPPAINRGEQPQKSESGESAHDANIQQPVIHLGLRSNLHSPAVHGSVRKCCQDRRLVAASRPAFAASTGVRIFNGTGANFKIVGTRLITYPPCPRSQRGRRLARRATSPSIPTPATQQKYFGLGITYFGFGAASAPLSPAVITPRSIARTLPEPLQNFFQPASESRTPPQPDAPARSHSHCLPAQPAPAALAAPTVPDDDESSRRPRTAIRRQPHRPTQAHPSAIRRSYPFEMVSGPSQNIPAREWPPPALRG